MKLEDQVCTLEQAKKLKELLKIYDTNFYWVEFTDGASICTKKNVDDNLAFDISLGYNMVAVNRVSTAWKSIFPVFTVAELSVMLGSYAETYLTNRNKWKCGDAEIEFDTQAQSSADRLIYLLEQNILSIEEVNKRLKQ